MTSVWLDGQTPAGSDPVPSDGRYDDLVVGAGLTGLTTALLLARAGRHVGVVEARQAGVVTTGRSTAKVSLLQGTVYSSLLRHHSRATAGSYVEANREGQQWLLRFCSDHGVDWQTRDAITYAADEKQLATVRREHEAASAVGLPVQWRDDLDVPFPLVGATLLPEQAQVDPVRVVQAMVDQLRAHGGTLHEDRRVVRASHGRSPEVVLSDGTRLRCENLVLATGIPVLDRGLFFAKVEPQRSYGLAFRGVDAPTGMYLSAGSSSRSVRDLPTEDGSTLLVGGAGHPVGRTRSAVAHLDELRAWTAEHFPGAAETHAWSAQDYTSYDSLPHVGRLPRGGGRIWFATGFGKWGMSNGPAAGLAIAAGILGDAPRWSRPLERKATGPLGVAGLAKINLGVGRAQVASLLEAETTSAPADPQPGEGVVGRRLGVPVGVAGGPDGSCRVLGVCTHLGGTLRWNDAEMSWDCPLHGSRFAPDGEVLEGPATRPLRRLG